MAQASPETGRWGPPMIDTSTWFTETFLSESERVPHQNWLIRRNQRDVRPGRARCDSQGPVPHRWFLPSSQGRQVPAAAQRVRQALGCRGGLPQQQGPMTAACTTPSPLFGQSGFPVHSHTHGSQLQLSGRAKTVWPHSSQQYCLDLTDGAC